MNKHLWIQHNLCSLVLPGFVALQFPESHWPLFFLPELTQSCCTYLNLEGLKRFEEEQEAKDRVIPAFGADVGVISRSCFVVLTIKQRLNSPFPPALIVPVLFIKLLIRV